MGEPAIPVRIGQIRQKDANPSGEFCKCVSVRRRVDDVFGNLDEQLAPQIWAVLDWQLFFGSAANEEGEEFFPLTD